MKNKFAVQLMATKAALTKIEKDMIVERTLNTWYEACGIALNEKFGFGKERIEQFRETVAAVIREYGALQEDTDKDYADGKLADRYAQIMAEKKHEANCRWATRTEQAWNRRLFSNNSTGIMGVSKSNGKYVAYIQRNKKLRHLGTFDNIEDAEKARRTAV